MCDSQAWNYSVHDNFGFGLKAVVLTASMTLNPSTTGLEMLLQLHPLKHEQSCRLHRRFGPDRFLELQIPSLDSWNSYGIPKEESENTVARWLTQNSHCFLGRNWAAFWVRSEGRRSTTKDSRDSKTLGHERVSFFATDSVGHSPSGGPSPLNNDGSKSAAKCTRNEMLQWLLQFDMNGGERYLKLLSRVSLGAKRSYALTSL